MTDKQSTEITLPPAYSYVPKSKSQVAKICAWTSICVTLIIAAAVSLGLYFTREGFQRHQEFTLNMKNQQEEIPIKISLHTEENLEYVQVPKMTGYNEVIVLRDYNQGLMAMKDLTMGGDCLIGGFNGKPEDIKEVHKTLTNNKDIGIKAEKEMTFSILMQPIHPEVLTFAAGKAIAKFCNGSSYWMVTKDLLRKKRSPQMLPGIQATQVVVNPVPLRQELVNANRASPLDLNMFLQKLQANPITPVNGLPNINGQMPANIAQNPIATFTPVLLGPANNNALNIAGSGPANVGFFNSPLVNPPVIPTIPAVPGLPINNVITNNPSLPTSVITNNPSLPTSVVTNIPSLPTSVITNVPSLPTSVITNIPSLPNSMITNIPSFPNNPTPSTSPLQPTNALCDDKCVVAQGTGALGIAQAYYFCNLNCVPKSFANGR